MFYLLCTRIYEIDLQWDYNVARGANWYLLPYWLRLDTLCCHIFGHSAIVGASNICQHNGHFIKIKRKNNIFIILLRKFYFQVLLVRINIFKGLIVTFNVLFLRCIICYVTKIGQLSSTVSVMAASSKSVTDAIK